MEQIPVLGNLHVSHSSLPPQQPINNFTHGEKEQKKFIRKNGLKGEKEKRRGVTKGQLKWTLGTTIEWSSTLPDRPLLLCDAENYHIWLGYLLSFLSWLEPVCPLFMCSMFQDGSTGGSWYSSGFRAKAKSGNVGAVSMILQSRYPKPDVNYSYGSFYQQRTTRLQLGAKSEGNCIWA